MLALTAIAFKQLGVVVLSLSESTNANQTAEDALLFFRTSSFLFADMLLLSFLFFYCIVTGVTSRQTIQYRSLSGAFQQNIDIVSKT